MDSLPIELIDVIASHGPDVYYGLLGYKFFATTLNYNKQLDFMILFGHSIKITKDMIEWCRNGLPHRIGGPARTYINGNEHWYQNGKYHRDDGHACEWFTGTKKWYRHGKLHRDDDLSSIEWGNGNKEWFINGLRHRYNDLPTVELVDGTKGWYRNKEFIRL